MVVILDLLVSRVQLARMAGRTSLLQTPARRLPLSRLLAISFGRLVVEELVPQVSQEVALLDKQQQARQRARQ